MSSMLTTTYENAYFQRRVNFGESTVPLRGRHEGKTWMF
jgi:hypothetical protein